MNRNPTSRVASQQALRLANQFYCVSRAPTILPDAVIALNSPGLGEYEAAFIRSFHSHRNQQQQQGQSSYSSYPYQRPLLVCADGAFRRLETLFAQHRHNAACTSSSERVAKGEAATELVQTMVDFVVGDFDSLPEELKAKHEKEKRWWTVPTVREAPLDVLLPDLELGVHPSNAPSSRSPLPSPGAMWLQVRDQDTTDMEKCLRFLSRVFLAQQKRGPMLSHSTAASSTPAAASLRRGLVVVLGAQGGEWHHEEAVLRAAAGYSSDPQWLLDVRLHTSTSTVLFANPNGTTIFTRNPAFEKSTFGVVPLGDAPQHLQTRGLKWELQYHASNAAQTRTYLREYVFSTSNRLEDAVEVQCAATSADCAVALAIVHVEAKSIPPLAKEEPPLAPSPSAAPTAVVKVGVSILVRRWCAMQKTYLYLMIERGKAPSKGLWAFPGGSLNFQETALDAAKRELKEETNCSAKHVAFLPESTHRVLQIRSGSTHFVLLQVAGEMLREEGEQSKGIVERMKAMDDAAQLGWWTKDQVRAAEAEGRTVPRLTESIDAFEPLFNNVGKSKL